MTKKIKKKKNRILYWSPRILTILFILFISMFALDVFSEKYGILETIVALFMHLIPSLVLLIVLLIAWKYELVGGIVFLFFGFTYILMVHGFPLSVYFTIAGPAFLSGILWIVSWIVKKK